MEEFWKSQEDIYAEESIYTKFTSNKDTALFPTWHAASWKDKLNLLDKFDDERLVGFGKKIIYQESPETLPPDMFKKIKREIAKRLLSERKERWWTIPTLFTEIIKPSLIFNPYSISSISNSIDYVIEKNNIVDSKILIRNKIYKFIELIES